MFFMDIEEIIATEEDLKKFTGRTVSLYRFHEKPYVGIMGIGEAGLPVLLLEKKVIPFMNLDVLDLGPAEVVYVSEKGI
jgi:hypothetical protein